MNTPPCKDCSDRKVGCHSSCENYVGWTKEHDKVVKERCKQGSVDAALRHMRKGRRFDREKYIRKESV